MRCCDSKSELHLTFNEIHQFEHVKMITNPFISNLRASHNNGAVIPQNWKLNVNQRKVRNITFINVTRNSTSNSAFAKIGVYIVKTNRID